MKKILYVIGFWCLLLAGCQENEMNTFDHNGAVYFQLASNWSDGVDSVVYSFAGKVIEQDTIWLQVDLMGEAVDHDRSVKLAVDAENTTAVEGTHYAALQPSYILPAGAYQMQIPVVLYNKDPQLEEQSFQLAIQLEPTQDLQLGLTARTKARIVLTAMLVKPSYWESQYTREEFIANAEWWIAAGTYMDNYFYENYPIIDPETNMPIEPWL